MAWLKRGLCGMDLRKHTYIIASLDILLSVAAMIVGFLVIINPEKYISAGEANMAVNETLGELVAADGNVTEAEQIEEGVIGSPEQFHYLERVKDLQNQLVEGIKKVPFWSLNQL